MYNRGFSQGIQSSLDTITQSSGKVRKDLVDQRVVEGHIVPHRLIFTSHAPTSEYQTVAWLPKRDGIKVNISLQVRVAPSQSFLGACYFNQYLAS